MWHHVASRDQVINAYSCLGLKGLILDSWSQCRSREQTFWAWSQCQKFGVDFDFQDGGRPPSWIHRQRIYSMSMAPAVNSTCWSLSLCSAAMRPNNSSSNIRPNNVNNRPNVADVDWLVDNSYFGHFVVHIVVYELDIFVSNNHCAQCKRRCNTLGTCN